MLSKLKNYFFSPRYHFSRFQFNLAAMIFAVFGFLFATYFTTVKLSEIFATNDTYKTWTFNSANASGFTYTAADVTVDDSGGRPKNKILNSTFDTDLTSWTEVPSYTLNDQFTTDRAAGAVNGTSSEPTGGTRTVVDTNSKLSITNSQLSFATGGVDYGNPGIWYPSLTRGAGKILVIDVVIASGRTRFGFDTNTSSTPAANAFYFIDGAIWTYDNDGTSQAIGTYSGVAYKIALVQRTTGAYYYIIGGGAQYPNWTLLYISSLNSTSPLYPNIGVNVTIPGSPTVDNIRIPTSTWLPTPLAYDTFTRSDGAIGNSETTGPDAQTTPSLAWTGGAISSNKNVITPSLGSELVTNGGFDSDTSWTKGTGWTISSGVSSHAGA